MSVLRQPLTVERARRELARLRAFKDRGAWNDLQAGYRRPSRFTLGTLLISLICLPVELLGLGSGWGWNRHGPRTRFERLQHLDKLIAEREDVVAGRHPLE